MEFLNLLPFPVLVFLTVYLCSKARNPFVKSVVISCFWFMTFMFVHVTIYFQQVRKAELEGLRGDPVDFFYFGLDGWSFLYFFIVAAGVELITLPVATLCFYRKWQFGLLSFLVALYTCGFYVVVPSPFAFFPMTAASIVLGVVGWQRNEGRILATVGMALVPTVAIIVGVFF
jgi:hypothetical protein